MKLTSALPISHMSFAHWHTDDTEVGVALAKAAFVLSRDGMQPQVPAPEITMVDEFEATPETSALVHEQDIAPHKPKTDLILRGAARSFEGAARADWPVSIEIPDLLYHEFYVRGPARWEKARRRWQLSKPELTTEVPLNFARAYGGLCREGESEVFFEENPAGLGFMTEKAARDLDGWAAPQIGLLAEFMDAQPFQPMSVLGTMPIAKAWLPRRAAAGTFDERWERERHPRMPLDYDLAFWNAAPTRLQLSPYLIGDEKLLLKGISHSRDTVAMRLPGAKLALRSLTSPELAPQPMALDTVDIDVHSVDAGEITVTLLWRTMVAERDAFFEAEIIRG